MMLLVEGIGFLVRVGPTGIACIIYWLCAVCRRKGMPVYSSTLTTEVLANTTRKATFNDVRHATDEGGKKSGVQTSVGCIGGQVRFHGMKYAKCWLPLTKSMVCVTVFKQGYLCFKSGLFGTKKRYAKEPCTVLLAFWMNFFHILSSLPSDDNFLNIDCRKWHRLYATKLYLTEMAAGQATCSMDPVCDIQDCSVTVKPGSVPYTFVIGTSDGSRHEFQVRMSFELNSLWYLFVSVCIVDSNEHDPVTRVLSSDIDIACSGGE